MSYAMENEITDDEEDERMSADELLRKIVPYGQLPALPEGFPALRNLTTDRFDVKSRGHSTVLTSDLDEPVNLLGDSMKLEDVSMTFLYKDKRNRKSHWKFHAEGKWKHGNMSAKVRIEESKVGNHHTLVASTSKLNLFDLATDIAEKDSVQHAGINLKELKQLVVHNVEMYSVFKGKGDYVFMMSGEPTLEGTKASDCKVFIRRTPKKKGVFSVLLEFNNDLPSRVLLKLISDDLFKVPFINHLVAKTHIFRSAPTKFGFVASTGSIDKIPLRSFGGGILSDELGSHVSKGLTLLLPIQLGLDDSKPVKVAVIIAVPKVKFITAKHENVSLAQTLKALSPTSVLKGVPNGFPSTKSINIHHFTYDINQETFSVAAKVTQPFPIIPSLLYMNGAHVTFRHHVADAIDVWSFQGHGVAKLAGTDAKLSLSTDEDLGITFISGHTAKLSVRKLAKQYGLSFIPDEESRAIIEKSKMEDFLFINPRVKSAVSQKHRNKYIHISGRGKFPQINKYIDAEAVVYDDGGQMKTAVSFIFADISVDYMINALTDSDTSYLDFLGNSINTTLVLSSEKTVSLFENPILKSLSFEKGLSVVSRFHFPASCSKNPICESAQSLLGFEQFDRLQLQGVVKRDATLLSGRMKRDYALGNGLLLKDNILQFEIGPKSTMSMRSRMTLPKDRVAFYGSLKFTGSSIDWEMKSTDKLFRFFGGGVLSFTNLHFSTTILNSLPLGKLNISANVTLGAAHASHKLSTAATIEYTPKTPEYSHIIARFSNITVRHLIKAFSIKNASIPESLSSKMFSDDLVAKYSPGLYVAENFTLSGNIDAFGRNWHCRVENVPNNGTNTLYIMSRKFSAPIVLAKGLITLQDSERDPKSGPKLFIEIAPNKTEYKLITFARLLGIGSDTQVEISKRGTGFRLFGSLFSMPESGLLLSSDQVLGSTAPIAFKAYGCLPGIYAEVTRQAKGLVQSAANQAEGFISQANVNLEEAKAYYRHAAKNEEILRHELKQEKVVVKKREQDLWLAGERLNSSCQMDHCTKSCIGCPDWNRCCSHDVFGSCVQCPSWNKCCYKSGDPSCLAHNHGCNHIRKVATKNLHDAEDLLADAKKRLEHLNSRVFDSEFSKGKTKAVLDAAAKALSLIDRDSTLGIQAARAIRRFGIDNVVNISSVCFATPVQNLSTGCIEVKIKATLLGQKRSLDFNACLNQELIPKMAHFVADAMFPNIEKSKNSRSVLSEEKPKADSSAIDDDESSSVPNYAHHVTKRVRRNSEEKEQIQPFWDMLPDYNPLTATSRKSYHQSKFSLRKTWKIPASKKGKCRIYRQLLDICKDMMLTVKKMFSSYSYEKFMFRRQKTLFERKLKHVAEKLEGAANGVSGTESQMRTIERALNYLSDGVQKWESKCVAKVKKQNEVSVRAWIRSMDERIKSLGGEGVVRFQKNLFRAFDELLESDNVPSSKAAKAVTVLQRVRQIRQAFEELFEKHITLMKAHKVAGRVLYDIHEIKDVGIYCRS